ncbi:OB-fold nucleic acid binding domain-containing protein [Mariniluteicoccus flavus]
MGSILGRLKRLTSSNEELESEERQRTAVEAGARTVRSCSDRERVTVRGTLDTVTLSPRESNPELVAELNDGSGTVTVTWMGRRQIAGIRAGTTIEVEGRISCQGGVRRMFNPRYRLLEVPRG